MKATARTWIFPVALALTVAALVLGAMSAKGSAQERDGSLAPELSGLGTAHMAVTTDVPKAQAFFDQGLRLLYAFNHEEARRAFREAARLDPSLSMAHWGIALTLAPNLNAPMTPEQGRGAIDAIQQARRTAHLASGRERALIDALAARFAVDPASPRPPLDRAYADAMARLAEAYPDDPNVATLYADAVMNTMPWDYWQKDGSPKPETAVVSGVLERAIAANPDHAGAHHYYVHLLEASDTPERAEASADRLGALMPAAGHMVHMPAHIYLRVGRYADAAEANVRAIAADEDYLAQCQAQGLYPVSYYPHNLHFLWAAATLEGRSAVAIDAARQVAAKVPHHHAGALAWTADFPVTPWLAYARFGRWQEMLTEPRPPASEPYATGIWHYARGLAFIARRQTARAEGELAALTALLDHEAFRTTLKDSPLLINLQIASRIVRGELAARAHRFDEAIQIVSEAVALEDGIPYNEPPVWHQPTRQVLGALLLDGRTRQGGRGRLSPGPEAVPRQRLVALRAVAEPPGGRPLRGSAGGPRTLREGVGPRRRDAHLVADPRRGAGRTRRQGGGPREGGRYGEVDCAADWCHPAVRRTRTRVRRAHRVPARRDRLVALVRPAARAPAADRARPGDHGARSWTLEQAARGLSVRRHVRGPACVHGRARSAHRRDRRPLDGLDGGAALRDRSPEPCGGPGPDGLLPDAPPPRHDPGVLGHGVVDTGRPDCARARQRLPGEHAGPRDPG